MAEPETLAALKRAYADTLLNTTKEAAARVLVSEKKARSYQRELVTVRDEALHTLLRLKHMFDSKVKETEMISLKQQQKVEELEAQLGEAEDIVGELRLELRELRDELKKYLKSDDHEEDSLRKNSDPEVSCSDERSGAVASSCIPVEQSGSVVAANGMIKIPSLTRGNSIKRCSSKDCHHTLPSILTKRREAEGCTQMIHTVIANGDRSSSVQVGDVNGVCPQRVTSCKNVETLEMPGCAAAASDSTASVFNNVKDGEDSVSLKTPLCEEAPVSAVNKSRCIKFTFQRKRKKEVLSSLDGDSSFEESRNVKQKTGEKKEDGYLESLKPSFTGESSQDSLRATQQLVPITHK
ncbi:unnamed protein product [Microthlaspi erraticum]|uniref:Uncharacterized protein n=1 Tax=Microthlaspi erraticum TaxID=1685480 RepID=A0A6D2K5C9_9BRAS|nr:unnamed protein product [Microthlaspi erraticum]